MRFSCENCQAKYQVADEKVAGKTIRMKCRKCGNSIEVKPVHAPGPSEPSEELGATEQHPIAPPPETQLGDGLAARSLASPAFPGPDVGPASRLPFDSSPGFDRAPESLRLALGAEASDLPAHFWYVAIGGAPVGPIALAELVAKARDGLVNDKSLAWREGLGEWQPVGDLPELVDAIGPALQHAPPPRSAAFPPAPPTAVPGRPAPAVVAPSPEPSVAPRSASAAAAPPKKDIGHGATLAATPISNELRAILDSSPALVAPHVVDASPPAKVGAPETSPSPRDEHGVAAASVRFTKSRPSIVGVVLGTVVGLVVGFAAGRFSAPAPVVASEVPTVHVQSAPVEVRADDKLDDVPAPPTMPEDPKAAPKPAPRVVAAPPPRAALPAPAPPPASRPVTAAPPPPPMPSFGGGGASLTEGQIAGVLAQRKVQLRRACWERIENHEAAVKVQATISIDGAGRVSSVDAQGTDAAVTACIRQQIKEWPFPATGAPTTATLPFSFVSQ